LIQRLDNGKGDMAGAAVEAFTLVLESLIALLALSGMAVLALNRRRYGRRLRHAIARLHSGAVRHGAKVLVAATGVAALAYSHSQAATHELAGMAWLAGSAAFALILPWCRSLYTSPIYLTAAGIGEALALDISPLLPAGAEGPDVMGACLLLFLLHLLFFGSLAARLCLALGLALLRKARPSGRVT
jgi:hypothetical protein